MSFVLSNTNYLSSGGELIYLRQTDSLPFDNTIQVYIGKTAESMQPCTTNFIDTTVISFVTPKFESGEALIKWTFALLPLGAIQSINFIYKSKDIYNIKLNGIDITKAQIQRFLQKQELSIIKQYGLASNNIGITVPAEYKNIMYKNSNNDRVSIYKNQKKIYTGYIVDKVKNYSKNIFEIGCSPLFNILSKMEVIFTDTVATPPINRLISLIQQYAPSDYMTSNISALDGILFPNSSIIINSNGSVINVLNTIIQLAELLNIGIYIDENFYIRLVPVPTVISKGKDIKLLDVLIENPNIPEDKTFYYDTVSLDYTQTLGGSQSNYTSGTGSYIKKVSANNIYFNSSTAIDIADRTKNIYNKIYHEAEFKIVKTFDINITDFFHFDNYYFICNYKEETLQHYIIYGIGIDSEGN